MQDKLKKKQVGLYVIENIDNPNLVTLAINQKNILRNTKIMLLIKNIKALKKHTRYEF